MDPYQRAQLAAYRQVLRSDGPHPVDLHGYEVAAAGIRATAYCRRQQLCESEPPLHPYLAPHCLRILSEPDHYPQVGGGW
jgi:hypothetical protein